MANTKRTKMEGSPSLSGAYATVEEPRLTFPGSCSAFPRKWSAPDWNYRSLFRHRLSMASPLSALALQISGEKKNFLFFIKTSSKVRSILVNSTCDQVRLPGWTSLLPIEQERISPANWEQTEQEPETTILMDYLKYTRRRKKNDEQRLTTMPTV